MAEGGGGLIGASVLGSGISTIGNMLSQHWTNKQNESLTRESWTREDNAVQRRTADLQAAGINPLLAAGQAASSSSAIPMKAPEIADFGGAFVAGKQAETQDKLAEHTKTVGEANLQNSTKVANAQVDQMQAQTQLIDAQSLQALHDMAIYKRRGTTSKDSGLMNQIMTGIDNLAESLAGRNTPGRILQDAAKGVIAGTKIVPKKIYWPGAKLKEAIEEGKNTPKDPWQRRESDKTIKPAAKSWHRTEE